MSLPLPINLFDYTFLSLNALETASYLVVSLEKLLLLKALAIHDPKNERDLRLIIKRSLNIQYGKDTMPQ